MTGSGKTAALHALKDAGEQILDLESFANHRGSSYGKLGIASPQPSTEHFENEIGMHLVKMDLNRPIWVEDESHLIGSCHIPSSLFDQMRIAPLILLDVPRPERVKRLLSDYGNAPAEQLIAATLKIGKQLGGQRKKEALTAIEQGRLDQAIEIVLEYYDASYRYSLMSRTQPIKKLSSRMLAPIEWAKEFYDN